MVCNSVSYKAIESYCSLNSSWLHGEGFVLLSQRRLDDYSLGTITKYGHFVFWSISSLITVQSLSVIHQCVGMVSSYIFFSYSKNVWRVSGNVMTNRLKIAVILAFSLRFQYYKYIFTASFSFSLLKDS
jgi:hypothetical protein